MRDPYFDNVKAILIILVVIGHILDLLLIVGYNADELFNFIYLFHMPAFILLSGYFAKHVKNPSKAELKYICIYLIATLVLHPFAHPSLLYMLLIPYYVLWYLISLSFWYVLMQFFVKLKHSIILSIIIAVLFGYLPIRCEVLSISRTVVYFPFFLVGYYLKQKHFELLKTKKVLSSISLIIIFISLFFVNFNREWLYNCYNYAYLGNPEWYAGIYRIGLLFISAISTASFFALVPTKVYLFTKVGKHTLAIFLLHAFIITLFSNIY